MDEIDKWIAAAPRYHGELSEWKDYADLFYFDVKPPYDGQLAGDFPSDRTLLFATAWSEGYEGGSFALFLAPGPIIRSVATSTETTCSIQFVRAKVALWVNETRH